MALILNIDTAVDAASVCLAKDGDILTIAKNEKQKDHAAWLHIAIKNILEKNNLEMSAVDAVAITAGPGSYTGLRIGLAAAKGICYALHKPLICLNTLEVMAAAAKNVNDPCVEGADLLCPMIDARRMEVFTAVYDKELRIIKEPSAMELNENSFDKELEVKSICFLGNGSGKFRALINNSNALFSDVNMDAAAMVPLSDKKFLCNEFADLAYAGPLYLKEFYTPAR